MRRSTSITLVLAIMATLIIFVGAAPASAVCAPIPSVDNGDHQVHVDVCAADIWNGNTVGNGTSVTVFAGAWEVTFFAGNYTRTSGESEVWACVYTDSPFPSLNHFVCPVNQYVPPLLKSGAPQPQ